MEKKGAGFGFLRVERDELVVGETATAAAVVVAAIVGGCEGAE